MEQVMNYSIPGAYGTKDFVNIFTTTTRESNRDFCFRSTSNKESNNYHYATKCK